MIDLTLIYEDGSTFFVGGFNSMEALNKWLDEEKTRPYWKSTTTWQINDRSQQGE